MSRLLPILVSVLCLPLYAQQQDASVFASGAARSPHPYVGGSGVVWSHTYSSPGQTQARVELTIDLGAGDVLLLKDAEGVVQATYSGQGPNIFAPNTSVDDLGLVQSIRFQSAAIYGDTVTLELQGATGGYGVDVHGVSWGRQSAAMSASAGRCDMTQFAPAAFESVAGPATSSFPWNRTAAMRVLYAYGGSAVGFDRPVRICAVRFRTTQGAAAAPVDYDFRMDVSTGLNPAQALDPTFENNHGADRITVFDGVLSAPGSAGGSAPGPFDLEVPFSTPFEWDPRCGALLLDIRYRSGSVLAGTGFDTTGTSSGEAVGRIFAGGDANAAVATTEQETAYVVQLCQEVETLPASGSGVELGGSSNFPFRANGSGSRTMFSYDPSQIDFAGRHRITALGWRPRNGNAFGGDSYDMRIRLSTGVNATASTSATFEDNHGADVATVFDGVFVAEPTAGGTAPNPFDLTVPLSASFEYNPANGPLIVDIQMRGHNVTSGTAWDGLSDPGLFRVADANDPNATVGSFISSFALVMGLETEPCLTIPESNDEVDGNSASSFPFNPGTAGSGPQLRVQNVYDPGELALSEPQFIQHLGWRPDSSLSSFGPVTYECTIDLSTSAVAASALGSTFDSNHGSDRSRVFDGKFSVPFVADTSDLNRFPIQVKLDTPFFYDPANGPLLIDIRMLDADGETGIVDATNNFTAPVSNAQNFRVAHITDPNATVADFPTFSSPQQFAYVIRISGRGANATSINYGTGCAGTSGTPRAVNFSLPTLPNPEFSIGVTDTEVNAPAIVLIGLTEAALPLALFGAPGCTALNNFELGASTVVTDATGMAEMQVPLPNNPAFVGFTFQHQCAVLDLSANTLGLVFSDGQEHVTRF